MGRRWIRSFTCGSRPDNCESITVSGMAKNSSDTDTGSQPGREGVISIIGPGMRLVGDCDTEGTLRIEGTVEGTVRAGKAVVVGKEGVVDGDIVTQDAVIGGRVTGSIVAESRLELQATCAVEGQVRARRIKLEEGGKVNGTVQIGEVSGEGSRMGGSIHSSRDVTEAPPETSAEAPARAGEG